MQIATLETFTNQFVCFVRLTTDCRRRRLGADLDV